MTIYSVTDDAFRPYGRIVEGFDASALTAALAKTPQPETGVEYTPEDPTLQALPDAAFFSAHLYGGMPVQMGWCNGHNTKLNCLEYHRDSEFNLGTEDFVLLLARVDEIEDGKLDTAKVRAFRVPAGTLVEVYATSLHYAPCHTDPARGFRVLVALPKGTNGPRPNAAALLEEDNLLWACNKWLLAHPESDEAAANAYAGLTGHNIDIEHD